MLLEINQWPHEVYIIFIYFNYYLYFRPHMFVFTVIYVFRHYPSCIMFINAFGTDTIGKQRGSLDMRETDG